MFQTGFPSSIRSSKLHIQRQVFVRPLLLPAASRLISVRRSKCFRRVVRPSSGTQNCTYSVRYLSDQYCYLARMEHPGQVAVLKKGTAFPLEAWSGPESSRTLRFPDFMTTAQDSGKDVSLTHRSTLPPGNAPGTHFC